MFKKLMAAAMLFAVVACEAEAASSARFQPVAWRGGYRYRQYSAAATSRPTSTYRGSYGYRGSSGRTSALDYPSYTQPYSTRINQWNKYPNQPYYLRGERKSLLILP